MSTFSFVGRLQKVAFVTALLALALCAMLPVRAHAATATAKCFDALAGVAFSCPATSSFAVDGQKPGTFVDGKCYTLSDTSKGYVATDCADPKFQNVVPTQGISGSTDNAQSGHCPANKDGSKPLGNCNILEQYLNPIINAFTIVVILAVVISMVIGGIQYSTSADQPGAQAAARRRIINAVIAMICFSFLWAFLQWIVPGGIL